MKKNHLKVIPVLLPLIGGGIIGFLTRKESKSDYTKFKQPPFSPPKEAFGIVWPILYLAMGVAHSMILSEGRQDEETERHFNTQLGLNYLWSILYFKLKLRGTALVESYGLLISVVLTAVSFYRKNKTAGLILLPYVIWCCYASYLNSGTVALNYQNPAFSKDLSW